MATTAEKVRELRDKTGAGVMDCKEALSASGEDLEQAVDFLRKKGSRRPRSARTGKPATGWSAPTSMPAPSSAS